jgi:hypothetical protein
MSLDPDALSPEELSPRGGQWHGLLFDNPTQGIPPGLTWTFKFRFAEVSREYGDTSVSLTVDWVPLPGADWTAMTGQSLSSDTFADSVECSAYFFDHHTYRYARLRVLEQQGSRLRVAAEVEGDEEGLGVPVWNLEEWLDFDCIYVQLDGVETVEEAAARLAEFTNASGLVGTDNVHNVKFVEDDRPGR